MRRIPSILSLVGFHMTSRVSDIDLCTTFSIKRHKKDLEEQKIAQVRRWVYDDHDYPYRSHLQPFTGYMALIGCLFLLVVCNGAFLWKGFHPEPFLSSYLIVSYNIP